MSEWTPPDRSRSRAVLVGTSKYTELPSVPAAAHSLRRMHRLLTGPLCGWPADRVTLVPEPRRPADLPDRLVELYGQATDVALFYYVGHGQIDYDNRLCLGLTDSLLQTERRATTSLTFDAVRQALVASPARMKVVILDCCFAGNAVRRLNTLAAPGVDMAALAGGTGAYVLAATDAAGTAWFESAAESRTPHTYFTKFLAEIVEGGIPGAPAGLTLDPIYRRLREDLPAAGKPAPVRISRDDGHAFLFARNTAAGPTAPEPARPPAVVVGTTRRRRPRRRTVLASLGGVLAATTALVVTLVATSSGGGGPSSAVPLTGSTAADTVHAVAYSPDGKYLAAAAGDGTVRLWNLSFGGGPTVFHIGSAPASSVAFSADGATLAVGGGNGSIERWDVASLKPLDPLLPAQGDAVVSVVYGNSDAQLAAADARGTVWVWDLITDHPRELRRATDKVYALAYDPKGLRLVGGGVPSGAVQRWDLDQTDAKPEPAFPATGSDVVRALAYSPDGSLLATGGNAGDVKLWNVATQRVVYDFTGQNYAILTLAFSHDGHKLAAGAAGGDTRVWDVTTRTRTDTFPTSHDTESLAFNPAATRLATAGTDHRVHVWKLR